MKRIALLVLVWLALLLALAYALTRPPEAVVITTTFYAPPVAPQQAPPDWGEYVTWPRLGRLAEL